MFKNRFSAAGLILLAATALFVAWNLRTRGRITDWVDHTDSVIGQSGRLLALFLDAETGERGFLLTGEPRYLAPYDQALAAIPGQSLQLRLLTADDPSQQERLNRLDAAAKIELNSLVATIRARKEQGPDAARQVMLTDIGRKSMDEIRMLLAQFDDEERKLLTARIRSRQMNAWNITFGGFGASLSGLFLLVAASGRERRHAAEMLLFQRSEQELELMKSIAERAPLGILLLDRSLRVIQVSQRWLDDVGVARETVVGRNLYESFPEVPDRWRERYRRTVAGESDSGTEEFYLNADGTQHCVNWQISPWGDSGETTGGIVIYSDDVTRRKRAEAALYASEAQYRGLFEHMTQGIAYCKMVLSDGAKPDFIYLAVNLQFVRLTGLKDVAGKRASEVFPLIAELDPEPLRIYETVARTGEPRQFEVYLRALGQWHSVSAYSPERGFFVIIFDVIDERKQAEVRARQWQSAFEESESGIALDNPATGKIEAVNAAYARRLGYTPEELTGQDISFFYPAEELVRRNAVLRAADAEMRHHVLFETRNLRKDGTSFPVLVDITVVRSETGKAISHLKIIHDLTELRRTSEALRTSEARAQSLFENASQGILTADSDGRIVDANPMVQRLFDYTSSELIGSPVEMLLPPALHNRHVNHRASYRMQPRARLMGQGMELVARRRNGTEFPVEISLSYLAEDQGGLSIAFVSDITARKHADREREVFIASLKGALAEKTVLLQEVHHRVKNNLAVVASLLGMQAKMLGDPRAAAALSESQQRVPAMARIHEYLYADERLDRVAFGKYVRQITSELAASYAVDPDAIRVHVAADDIDLPVHRAIPCGLILNELLTNALKYAFPDGRRGEITVRLFQLASGELTLSCQDDGVGFPENVNWQNSKSLGLRIMRILAKQIDGELALDRSVTGTKFDLIFQAAKPA